MSPIDSENIYEALNQFSFRVNLIWRAIVGKKLIEKKFQLTSFHKHSSTRGIRMDAMTMDRRVLKCEGSRLFWLKINIFLEKCFRGFALETASKSLSLFLSFLWELFLRAFSESFEAPRALLSPSIIFTFRGFSSMLTLKYVEPQLKNKMLPYCYRSHCKTPW